MTRKQMKITFWKGVFVADHGGAGEEALLKKCGFTPHEPTLCEPSKCRACRAKIGRRYFSTRVEDATRLRSYCNERALVVMKDHLQLLARSRALDSDIKIPAPPGLAYLPYQKAGIAYALQRKDTLFGDDMGLGKTVEALGFANSTRPSRILVVCPATLVLNWKLEAERWLCDRYRYYVPKNTRDKVPRACKDEKIVVITNYEKIADTSAPVRQVPLDRVRIPPGPHESAPREMLENLAREIRSEGFGEPALATSSPVPGEWYDLHTCQLQARAARLCGLKEIPAVVLPHDTPAEMLRGATAKKIRVATPLSESLRQPWDLGIYDEAHALKNPDTLRSQAVLGPGGLYDCSARALFLSGTPIENRPIEIWPIAKTLCPARFGDWWDFTKRYCGLHQEERGRAKVWVADGSTNPQELQQRLRTSFMVRRLKHDVLKELPPKRRQLIVMASDDVDWSRYPDLVRGSTQLDRAYDDALARLEAARTLEEYKLAAKELEAVTVGFTEMSDVRHQTALLKLPSCLRYADQLLSTGLDALVIFAHHKDVLEKIHEHYAKDSCVIYGDTPQKQRMPIVQSFQAGLKKVFIGGLRAAGTGITLTRAWNLVFFETDWNPATMAQAEDRLCRIGQKKMVSVHHPVLDGSLDANMVKRMVAKQAVIDRVLDHLPEDQRMSLGFEPDTPH